MKYLVLTVVAACVFAMASPALAGGGCCPSKAGKKAKSGSVCGDIFASMDLTADQKAKIAELEAACAEEGNTKEACSKYLGEMRNVLTEDQRAQFDAACEKKGITLADKAACGS